MNNDRGDIVPILNHKRESKRYLILIEIAKHQPAVNQSEIADAIGVTPQAVSEHIKGLSNRGHVSKLGRGRYEITPRGVDWLIIQNEKLRELTNYVAEEVLTQVDIEATIAGGEIQAGEIVTLSMVGGFLHANVGSENGKTTSAKAIGNAKKGEVVGVIDFEGILDYEIGSVCIISIPSISLENKPTRLMAGVKDERDYDLVAISGVEALVAARVAGYSVDIYFGTPMAITEAAMRGLDVLLIVTDSAILNHIDRFREAKISYEVIELK
jgi:putative transcriptional regulator